MKLEALQEKLSDIEERLRVYRKHLPNIGRFLLVLTFVEDAFRLVIQWPEQTAFLLALNFPRMIATAFLFLAIVVQIIGSFAVISRYRLVISSSVLAGFVVLQTLVYASGYEEGKIKFLFRNMSLIGGLLMLIAEEKRRAKEAFPGLPMFDASEASTYLQLFGRVMLVFLFGIMATDKHSYFLQKCVSWVSLVAAVLVAVGFKARYMTIFLGAILTLWNLCSNNFWSLSEHDLDRDVYKYYFFQNLSILGGLLLLLSLGPGGLSIDEKKKMY
eukprot:TRINITY_DN4664_c0_g1::TRINITY_DN4664_c0_g1_i1::g.19519::m.19519 TRINITY_DN4664_c0_g1::TRINITY_DN4664_c0_g1_i1::g.19519  ORF type:complete len:272 (-),score=55.88,sp/O74559/SURF4_SCHPO/36.96/4e-47,SURF4/PF02077.10/2.7e-72,K_trans/PF02705.11/0.89 TRINITY_DN4664_c0_g1_i1:408-1223(-)